MTSKLCVLTLGFLSATSMWAITVAPSTTFTGSITLLQNQTNDYFVYDANNGAIQGTQGVGISNPIFGTNFVPAGTFAVSQSIPQYITSGVATAIGLYSPTGVSVAVNQATYNAALNQETWSQVFAGTSESTIATALQNGDSATLESFLNQYSSDFISFSSNNLSSVNGGILLFSNAANGGSLSFSALAVGNPGTPGVSATPEPSTELLLGAGLSVVALAVRKLRKA